MAQPHFDDRNILGMFNTSYAQRFEGSWARSVSLFNAASDREIETYGIFGANSAMREWLGERKGTALRTLTYDIRNRKYEGTLPIPIPSLDRDKSGLLQIRMNQFAGDAAADHWEDLLIALINANGTCYDTFAFLATNHSWGDSGTQKNSLGATEVPSSNVSTTTAPTPTEAANIIMETVAHMMTIKNDKGRDVNGNMRMLDIIVATAPMFSAFTQAVNQITLAGTVDNPLNGLRSAGFKFNVRMVSRLTSFTEKILFLRTDGDVKPFILQEERPLQTKVLGTDSEHAFYNDEVVLGVDGRRGAGYGAWEHAALVTTT